MHVFFDVDYTLIDGDGALRPRVRRTFEQLRSWEHCLYLWSGLGERWEVAREHALEQWVEGCYDKPLQRYDQQLGPLGIPVRPDFVVDDHPHLVQHYGGLQVRPYRRPNPADREMDRVLVAIRRSTT